MINLESVPAQQNSEKLTFRKFFHLLQEKLKPSITEWPTKPELTQGSGNPDLDNELTRSFEDL